MRQEEKEDGEVSKKNIMEKMREEAEFNGEE